MQIGNATEVPRQRATDLPVTLMECREDRAFIDREGILEVLRVRVVEVIEPHAEQLSRDLGDGNVAIVGDLSSRIAEKPEQVEAITLKSISHFGGGLALPASADRWGHHEAPEQ
ncbi:MAG: hypothetical protein JNK15_07780 [Planctomycetes bacterium]|nr:hypothetical protein [Planctomycetota bacterium]